MAKNHSIHVPTLSDASPAYAALAARKAALHDTKNKLERAADDQRYALTTFRPDGGRGARVGALLGDDVTEFVDPASRLKEIEVEIADVVAAIREISSRMITERNSASISVTTLVRPAYGEKVAAVARSLIAAHIANRELCGIISDLNAADIAWTGYLAPMQATRVIGAPNDNQNALARYVQEAASLGFIDAREIPAELV